MANDLVSLVQAGTGTGSTGDNFRDHVPGAADGVSMQDYLMVSASWSPGFSSTYTSGTVHSHTLTFAENNKCPQIRASGGAAITLSGVTGNCVLTSQSVSGSEDGGGSAEVTLTGELESTTPSVSVDYSPEPPTEGTETPNVVFTAVGASDGGAGSDSAEYTIEYNDPGYPFNQPVTRTHSFQLGRRAHVYEGRWYTDSGYTNLYDTGMSTSWQQPAVGDDFSLWFQWRVNGGSWNNWGQKEWIDNRSGA